MEGSFAAFWRRSIISQEGGAHKALRTAAMSALSNDFIASLKPRFDAIADALVAPLRETTRIEFMSAFSRPFAGQAICVLLDWPIDDWTGVADDAATLGLSMGVECKRHEPAIDAACDRLMAMADQLIARARSGRDRESVVARLVDRFDAAAPLDEQALRDMIVIAIFGGVDTTKSQLGFAMALFIEHPEQWRALQCDPSLASAAIAEIIRTRPTTTWSTREALEDFEFQGQSIRRGETLHMLVHASGRDPAICADDQFDIQAPRRGHFGFGGGAHACLGRVMAETDMASALTSLARTVDEMRFAGEPVWLPDSGNTSPVALPINYTLRATA